MIIAREAETLAQAKMQEYIKECGCMSVEDVANALMKMVSMCGLGMCATVGQEDAVARLELTARYIANTQAGINWKMEKAN